MKKTLSAFLLVVVIFLQPMNAFAYKVGTHVSIAQQVLNDVLPDGKVTIGKWEYQVDDDILSSLRNHPNAYRMGNVGPDGFPDLIVPQITTHPGVPGAWQTDDWLRWMLLNAKTEEEKAFVYGYLGHAASDTFAHTYVNMYSGDVFLLDDGEQEVEERHFAIESYIEKLSPPLLDHIGNNIGNKFNNLSVPSRFLADNLILNDTVANQHLRLNAKFANHLVGMHKLRAVLDKTIAKTDKVIEPNLRNKIKEFEDKGIDLGNKLNDQIGFIRQKEEEIRLLKLALKKFDDAIDFQEGIIKEQNRLIDFGNAAIKEAIRLQGIIADAQREINNLAADLAIKLTILPFDDFCSPRGRRSKIKKGLYCGANPVGCANAEIACRAIPDLEGKIQRLRNTIDRVQREIIDRGLDIGRISADIAAAGAKKLVAIQAKAKELEKKLIDPANKLLEEAEKVLSALKSVERGLIRQIKDVKDFIDRLNGIITLDVNPIKQILVGWREDVDKAVVAYIEASGNAVRELMKPPREGKPLDPISEWKSCWGPVFLGIPRQIPGTVCFVSDSVEKLFNETERLRRSVGDLIWLIDPVGELARIILQEIKDIQREVALAITGIVAGENTEGLLRLMHKEIDADKLNEIFSKDNTEPSKGLLEIPDIASRINADMHLNNQGHFSFDQFHAMHDAVILTKLTLLRQYLRQKDI